MQAYVSFCLFYLFIFFRLSLLFCRLFPIFLIDGEIYKTIPIQFPRCFTRFYEKPLLYRIFSFECLRSHSQSDDAVSCKLVRISASKGPNFWRETQAWFRRRSTHVPNLTDKLSTAKERRLNQFGMAVLVWCGKSVKFDRVCRTFVELNLGSTHGTPSESDVAPVSLQSRTLAFVGRIIFLTREKHFSRL